MYRIRLWGLALLVVALGAATAAASQEISGSFQIMEGSQVIGAERFTIVFETDGRVTAESQGTVKQGDSEAKSYTRLILRKIGGPIHTYQREVLLNALPTGLAASYDNGILKIEARDGPRKLEKNLSVSPATMIADVGIWHHLHLLIHRYSHRTGGEQQFVVVAPSEMKLIDPVTVRHIGIEALGLKNGFFTAHKYFINRRDIGLVVWADKAGRILKIESPMQNITVELTKYDGERAAEVNPVQTMTSPALAYEPVQVVSDGVKLAGVFTRPRGLAGRLPAVLFLSDSGKHDRDGVAPTANLNLGTGRALDHLCQATGFAVLRMDDRNTGESEGDIPQNSLSVQANDAANLLDFLKKRPDVDPQRLAIIGHGEGANVAIMVAAKRPDLKAAVLLAPSDVPFSELMEEVVKTRHSADGGDPDGWKRSPILTILSHARQSDKKTVVLGGRPVYLDYYREWFAMKPVDDLRQTSARILHVQGGKDLQVYPKHAEGFRRALGGDKRYTFRQFDNLNHLFRPSKGTLGEYADPTATIDPAFVDYVAAWLQASL